MTKRKPDKVIEYRISLQDKEREILESAIGAYQVNRIMTPIVTLMNDISGMAVFLTLASALGFAGVVFAFTVTTPTEDMHVLLTDFFLQRDQAAMASGVTIAARGPIWGFVDILERVFGTNLPDFGGGYEPPSSGSSEPGRAPGTATGGVE